MTVVSAMSTRAIFCHGALEDARQNSGMCNAPLASTVTVFDGIGVVAPAKYSFSISGASVTGCSTNVCVDVANTPNFIVAAIDM